MDYHGYAGTILYVDLTSNEIRKEPLDLELARKFIGGFGINAKLAYDLIRPGIDPLLPENPLIFGSGTLVGTMAPGAAKFGCTTKFPSTGAVFTACAGGSFGAMLKWAGYDHLVITGRAKEPVYLRIFDGEVEVCQAGHLWGEDICVVTDLLWDKYGMCGVVCIGQAGENLVKLALAMVDKSATLGRGGLGAVMGSKNLKAIVCRGTKGLPVYHSKRFRKTVDTQFERSSKYPLHQPMVDRGLMGLWDAYSDQGYFAMKNWNKTPTSEVLTKYFGPEMYDRVKRARLACPSCFNAHRDIIELREGEFAGLVLELHTYIEAIQLACRFEIEDIAKAIKIHDLLNRYGLCLVEFSNLTDFVIDLYERGIITNNDTQGLVLKRDFDTALTLVEKMTNRDGFGDSLANGWAEVMNTIGAGSVDDAMIIKRQGCIRDPRVDGVGTHEFGEITCPRGPTSAWGISSTYMPDLPLDKHKMHAERTGASRDKIGRIFVSSREINIGRYTALSEEWGSVLNMLGICELNIIERFYSAALCAELYSAATGIELEPQELMEAAERAWNLFKAVNVREGFSREHDVPPAKWFKMTRRADEELHLTDLLKSHTLSKGDIEVLLDDYYDERGWDVGKGIPTRQKLRELGLDDVAQSLANSNLLP